MLTRIGMRWTTFTQLPVVFCAGSSEKLEPEADRAALLHQRDRPDVQACLVLTRRVDRDGFTQDLSAVICV